jgi:hypothetical protein
VEKYKTFALFGLVLEQVPNKGEQYCTYRKYSAAFCASVLPMASAKRAQKRAAKPAKPANLDGPFCLSSRLAHFSFRKTTQRVLAHELRTHFV